MTFRRVWNVLLLKISFYWSRITKTPTVWGQPFSASIEPTTACNLGCPECPSGLKQFTRETGNIDEDLNEKIIKELHKTLWYINFYFQGEPFIHPQFLGLVKKAHEHKIYTATSTNAHFISPKVADNVIKSGLDRMIISIDGTTQEVYEQYRKRGSLEKVLEGTQNMVAAKKKLNSKTPQLIFQFLVVKPNEHQIPEVFELAKKYEVDEVRLKTAQVYEYENGNPLIPENEKYSRYKKQKDGTYKLKNKMSNHCWRMWSSVVFTSKGAAVPCCFDKDAEFQMGNVSENKFKKIWKSPTYMHFRKQLLRNRQEISICKNCSEGTKVWT